MKIRIKVGNVEIEYSEPTTETDYQKIVSKDGIGEKLKHEVLLEEVEQMADKEAEIYYNK